MMFAAQTRTRRLNPIGSAMRWLVALVLVALAGTAQGEIVYVMNIGGVSRGDVLSGSVNINAKVLGDADVVLFELVGPKRITVARQGENPSFMVDPRTGENIAFDTTTLPDGRYRLKVTAVVENGQDRSRTVRFRVNNTLTEPEQAVMLDPMKGPEPQTETDTDVQVETDSEQDVFEEEDALDGEPAPTRSLAPQVVVINGDQEEDGLVTVLGNLQQASEMPEVSYRNAPAEFIRGSGASIRVLLEAAMPRDGDILAIAWSENESRMVDEFTVRVDLDNPQIPAADLDKLPAGVVELQLLVRESAQIHRIIRHRMRVVVIDPPPAPVVMPEVSFVDPPAEMTHSQTRDLRVALSADLPDGADILVLAWSDSEARIVDEFTSVLGSDLRIAASSIDLLPTGRNEIQVLTRLGGEVVGRFRHTLVLHDAPAPPQPEPDALPAVGFDSPPTTYTLGSGVSLALRASGTMPDDADVVVVAWSNDEHRMVDEFAHKLGPGEWSIAADHLDRLPVGTVNVQLLVRRDNQVKAIVSHWLTVEPEPAVVQPSPDTQPETTVLPSVQFEQTPASYTLGSGQSIAISATGPFPDGSDLLVIAWSSAEKRLVDEFAFTMTGGTLAIPASKLDLLPPGEVVLQLLPREDAVIYGQITHTIDIRPATESGNGDVIDGTDGSGNGGAGDGSGEGTDGSTDGGTDPESETETEPEPVVYTLAFGSGAASQYHRGSGVSIPLTVSQGLPGGSTVQLRAWSLDDGGYVDTFDTTLGSAPWRVGANKLDRLPDGRYRIDAALRVEGQAPVGVTHHITVRTLSGNGEEVSPSAMYNGFTTFQPSADTTVFYVSSSTGDDANDGLTPQTAVRTQARGVTLLRDGRPDWLLFRRGDTFNGSLGRWRKSGRSADEPMVIGSFGDAALPRPKFLTDGDDHGLVRSYGDDPVTHVAFTDLHGYANNRDPESRDFDGGRSREFGVRWSAAGGDIRFENLLLEFYAFNMGLGERADDIDGLTLHRCVLRNAYSDHGHSQGLYTNRVRNLTITECVFDHNGWLDDADLGRRTGFNHNMYLTSSRGVRIEGNVIANGSTLGIKLRSDTAGLSSDILIEGNLFVGNLAGFSAGSDNVDGDLGAIVHERLTIRGNVFTHMGGALPNGVVLGRAISVKQVGDAAVEDNLFIDKVANTEWFAVEVETRLPTGDVQIRRNIVERWPVPHGRAALIHEDMAALDKVYVSGNLVEAGDERFVDAACSVESFSADLSYASFANAIEAMTRQTKADWSDDLRAQAFVAHLQRGFELRPFD